MGLQSAAIAISPTSLTVTGGTSKTFVVNGEEVKNGIVLIETTEPDPRLRMKIIARTIASRRQADGTYSYEKRFLTFKKPRLLADGITVVTDTYKYESMVDSTTLATVDLANRLTFAQVLFDADFESLHTVGSLY